MSDSLKLEHKIIIGERIDRDSGRFFGGNKSVSGRGVRGSGGKNKREKHKRGNREPTSKLRGVRERRTFGGGGRGGSGGKGEERGGGGEKTKETGFFVEETEEEGEREARVVDFSPNFPPHSFNIGKVGGGVEEGREGVVLEEGGDDLERNKDVGSTGGIC